MNVGTALFLLGFRASMHGALHRKKFATAGKRFTVLEVDQAWIDERNIRK